jgi:hypothetical protein
MCQGQKKKKKYNPIAWNEKYKDALLENPVTP